MKNKLMNRVIAAAVFLISFVQFFITAQPSVSFWDCGEFLAAAFSLQVPHPPGTPFHLLMGRLFMMFPIAADPAFKMNMLSVLASALSVFFLYLIAVKLINNYRSEKNDIFTFLSAAIGALSFSFSDTFWFNGVEAEVYAHSTFFFAFVTYLIMLWNEKADENQNEKYLLMIAYLIGLSTGVHLMSVLAIVPVVMVIYFRKYITDDEACKKTGLIFLAHSALLLVIAVVMWSSEKSTVPPSPEEFQAYDTKFKMVMAAISAVLMGVFYKKLFTRNSFYMPIIFGGIALFVTYPGVVKYLPELIKSVGGETPFVDALVFFAILGGLGYMVYWTVKNQKQTLNLAVMSLFFIIIGFTTYTMVIIRANQQPPMNENEPDTFSELVSYLNREQYGDFPIYKRRFTSEPHQQVVYSEYTSDMDFFYRYQMDHMFNRYLFWNYIGRASWNQDDGVKLAQLYGIPFLLGLIGLFYHFKRDWKMASSFLIMFIFMGYLTAFYQNQQQPQPRERDYFYVGAFFVYSIWIALGADGVLHAIRKQVKQKSIVKPLSYAFILVGFIFVPVNMARTNWFTHDRSDNYYPWDYAYNILQSCAPNAVLFTYGDNDTFPLWYLQDVAGVRRDVRVACLSLLQTPWYMKQLKNTAPYGSMKVAMNMSDEELDNIRPVAWEPRELSIPVPPEVFREFGVTDQAVIDSGKITYMLRNTLQFGDVKALNTSDLAVKDIVESFKWKRPIYFAVTVPPQSRMGLDQYLRNEGFAMRLTPVKFAGNYPYMEESIVRKQLFSSQPSFNKEYKPGFNFRGLNDKSIFYEDNQVAYSNNYRNLYMQLAMYYSFKNNDQKRAIETLNEMEKRVPLDVIEAEFSMLAYMGNVYNAVGYTEGLNKLSSKIIAAANEIIAKDPNAISGELNPYGILSETYMRLKKYDKALEVLTQVQRFYPNDQNLSLEIQHLNALIQGKDSVK